MLNDGTGFKKIYLAMGFTDLRRGINGLANIVRFHFHLDPYATPSAILPKTHSSSHIFMS